MAKRVHHSKKKKRENAQKRLYWVSGITGALIVILVIVLLVIGNLPSSPFANDPIIMPQEINRTITNENSAGDPNAPVKVEVYSNYQCSHCKVFSEEVEPVLIENYVNTGKVHLVHNALSYQDSNSALAAYCAMDQDKFWQYHNILFANQTNEDIGGIIDENLSLFAEKLGMDVTQFNQCINSNKYGEKINQAEVEGYEKGITGTPMFIINGELVPSYHSVLEKVEQDLAELE